MIGRALAARRTKTEEALAAARRGGLFAFLEALDQGGAGPVVAEVRQGGRFDAFFQRSSDGAVEIDGAAAGEHPDLALEHGATLRYPAGVFAVKNLMREKDPVPRDVTLAGAAVDRTLLVLDGTLCTRSELVDFTIRDCTVHTDGNDLFDLRLKPASLTFERVRFVGFDSGLGGSCLLGTRALAVRAKDCAFLGGYGRSLQHCSLFDVRTDALLARFERCRVEQVELRVPHLRPGATVVFLGCALEDLIDDEPLESYGHAGLLLEGCTITYLPGGWQEAVHEDLNDLFPSWEQRMQR